MEKCPKCKKEMSLDHYTNEWSCPYCEKQKALDILYNQKEEVEKD